MKLSAQQRRMLAIAAVQDHVNVPRELAVDIEAGGLWPPGRLDQDREIVVAPAGNRSADAMVEMGLLVERREARTDRTMVYGITERGIARWVALGRPQGH